MQALRGRCKSGEEVGTIREQKYPPVKAGIFKKKNREL